MFYGKITKSIPKLSSNTLLICSTDQFDQGLHGLPLHLHLLDTFLCSNTTLLKNKDNYSNFSDIQLSGFFWISTDLNWSSVQFMTTHPVFFLWHENVCRLTLLWFSSLLSRYLMFNPHQTNNFPSFNKQHTVHWNTLQNCNFYQNCHFYTYSVTSFSFVSISLHAMSIHILIHLSLDIVTVNAVCL